MARLPFLLAPAALVLSASLSAQVPPPPPLLPPPLPAANPGTPARINLGKVLFWDEQLSSTRSVACGTCHIPSAGGGDPRTLLGDGALHPGPDGVFGSPDDVLGSPGVPASAASGHYLGSDSFGLGLQVTGRKAPSSINAAYAPLLFWDGRAGGQFVDPDTGVTIIPAGGALENQALGPLVSDVEMAHSGRTLDDVVARVAASEPLALSPSLPAALSTWIAGRSYAELFAEAFGDGAVTAARIGLATASYERTLFSNQTPFDALGAGVPGSLTPQEQAGRQVFNASGCAICHGGSLMSDNQFHYIGVRPVLEDLGRFVVSGNPPDRGAMRTPSLRNVELRAPYMHGGQLASLEEVIDFYDRGGDFNAPNKAPAVQPLNLSLQQKANLRAFLGRPLTDPRVSAGTAPFDRPRLASESGLLPTAYGSASAGSAGVAPRSVAWEPPHHDNDQLTLALEHGLGGAPTWLGVDPAASAGVPVRGVLSWLSFGPSSHLLFVGSLSGTGAGQGFTSVVFGQGPGAAAVGLQVFSQWFLVDAGAAGGGGISASEGLEFTVF